MVTADRCVWGAVLMPDWLSRSQVVTTFSPPPRTPSPHSGPIRHLSFRFEERHSCQSWFMHLGRALTNQKTPPQTTSHRAPSRQSLYPAMDAVSRGSVPPAIERCISHITNYGSERAPVQAKSPGRALTLRTLPGRPEDRGLVPPLRSRLQGAGAGEGFGRFPKVGASGEP